MNVKTLTGMVVAVFCILSGYGQERVFFVGDERFTVSVRGASGEDQEEVDTLYLFRAFENKPLLAVLHKDVWADSNSRSVMVGDYDATDSTFVLYHFWAKAGDAPVSPYGARIQTYGLEKEGLILKESRIYLETMSDYYVNQYRDKENLDYHVGVVFLHAVPESADERQELNAYVRGVEREYGAEFVWGEEADRLLVTVRERLAAELRRYTRDWPEHFNKNETGFGYKK